MTSSLSIRMTIQMACALARGWFLHAARRYPHALDGLKAAVADASVRGSCGPSLEALASEREGCRSEDGSGC